MQLDLFDSRESEEGLFWEALYKSYFSCRKGKRNGASALAYELDFERNLETLGRALLDGKWRPGRSQAFIVRRPVQREVFAAPFEDRVVHHWLMAHLNPLFESLFLPCSFACRKGFGTHFGIARMAEAVNRHDDGFGEAWALRMDIKGFFMAIDRQRLWHRLDVFMAAHFLPTVSPFTYAMVRQVAARIVNASPAEGSVLRGSRSDWNGLPADKSLFGALPGHGLPIGNLTSQILANFYLHPFDVWMKETYAGFDYGRYVDDVVLIGPCRWRLRRAIGEVRSKLQQEFGLTLHPKKVALQRVRHGVPFLGAVMYPGRVVPGKRIRGTFRRTVDSFNHLAQQCPEEVCTGQWDGAFVATVNAHLGALSNTRSRRFRWAYWNRLDAMWRGRFALDEKGSKVQPLQKRGGGGVVGLWKTGCGGLKGEG